MFERQESLPNLNTSRQSYIKLVICTVCWLGDSTLKGIQWLCKDRADLSKTADILVIRLQYKNLDLILFLLTDTNPVRTSLLMEIPVKADCEQPGCGGTCLSSQHFRGRGRQISVSSRSNLVYRESVRTARATWRKLSQKYKTKMKTKDKAFYLKFHFNIKMEENIRLFEDVDVFFPELYMQVHIYWCSNYEQIFWGYVQTLRTSFKHTKLHESINQKNCLK